MQISSGCGASSFPSIRFVIQFPVSSANACARHGSAEPVGGGIAVGLSCTGEWVEDKVVPCAPFFFFGCPPYVAFCSAQRPRCLCQRLPFRCLSPWQFVPTRKVQCWFLSYLNPWIILTCSLVPTFGGVHWSTLRLTLSYLNVSFASRWVQITELVWYWQVYYITGMLKTVCAESASSDEMC